MPVRHFYLLRHHMVLYMKFLLFCCLAPEGNWYLDLRKRGLSRRLWFLLEWTFPYRDTFLLDCTKTIFSYSYFTEIFSLFNFHYLLGNLLLFPTEITNLLFVIKNRQPLKQNFMLNCKKLWQRKKNCYKYCILWLCAMEFWP